MQLRTILAIAVLMTTSLGTAQTPTDREARERYERGASLYDQARYREAILEFEAARALSSASALEYNIGRCYERLEEWTLAADAFDRYLRDPRVSDAAAIRARVAGLRRQAEERQRQPGVASPPPAEPARSLAPSTPSPAPTVPQALRLFTAADASAAPRPPRAPFGASAIGVGVATLLLTATGAGLVATVGRDYGGREQACRAAPCSVDDLRGRLYGGYALLATAGIAAVVDVGLVVAWARASRRGSR